MRVRETLEAFDEFLAAKGLRFSAVLVGGAALGLLGVVERETRDCDVICPPIAVEILDAAREFAASRREEGAELDEDWLNNGPASLSVHLPEGWRERCELVFSGKAMALESLGRIDLLRSKLFAYCDRGIDIGDCIALEPTKKELREVEPWLSEQDGNPKWPAHVEKMLAELGRRLGHGV